jgi:LacI family transcriptional regulator
VSPKAVTIKTIAKEYGVTPATVSKALRDSSDIATETKRKIKEVADRLGYQPNFLARSLVSKRSNIIGIIMPNITTSFFGYTMRGISDAARKNNYETIILVNDENHNEERKNLEFLSKLQVDGIVIDAVPGCNNNDLVSNLVKKGTSIVFVDRKPEKFKTDSVTTNDIGVGYSITDNFITNGRKNIAFIGAINELSVAKERMLGYKKALINSNIQFNDKFVIPISYKIDNEGIKNTVRQFLDKNNNIDGFICAGGEIAYLTGLVLLENGYSIPGDVLLGEFGDNNVVHRLGVPFLTVDQSPYEIGKKAGNLLIDRINEKETPKEYKNILISSKLISHNPAAHTHVIIEEI